MAKAYEISIWDPHAGKFDEFLEIIKTLRVAFLEAGVSQVDLLSGAAGKDVGKVVVIQTFKGLADNGALIARVRQDVEGNDKATISVKNNSTATDIVQTAKK